MQNRRWLFSKNNTPDNYYLHKERYILLYFCQNVIRTGVSCYNCGAIWRNPCMLRSRYDVTESVIFFFFLIVCFTSYFVFSIAVLPHSTGVVYYHLLLRQETRIPRVAPFSFVIGIWDLFVHRGQKSYTPTAFGKLWTTSGVRCMKYASS